MQHDLDLTQSAFVKSRGDLTLHGCWHGERLRPCLVVTRTNRRGVPLVIELDSAWKWNPDGPDANPRMVVPMIIAFLNKNGLDATNPMTHHRVLSLIHDHLGDLIRMPVKPTSNVVVADAIRTDHDTGKTIHQEIVKRV